MNMALFEFTQRTALEKMSAAEAAHLHTVELEQAVASASGNEGKELQRRAQSAFTEEAALFQEASIAQTEMELVLQALQLEAALRIQACWRARKAWTVVQDLIRQVYDKIYDEHVGSFYYYNKRNGNASWKKPLCLGSLDILTADERRQRKKRTKKPMPRTEEGAVIRLQNAWRSKSAWLQLQTLAKQAYEKMSVQDSRGKKVYYYYNSITGESTWIKPKILGSSDVVCTPREPQREKKPMPTTDHEAALRIQHAWRCKMARRELVSRIKRYHQKFYDEENKAFFYYNMKTGQSTWKKPKALGFEEISMSPRELGKVSPADNDPSLDKMVRRFVQ